MGLVEDGNKRDSTPGGPPLKTACPVPARKVRPVLEPRDNRTGITQSATYTDMLSRIATDENVPVLKRLTVWLFERSIEVCLLGTLFGYLVSLSARDPSLPRQKALSGFWVYGIAVAVFLFILWLLCDDGLLRCDMAEHQDLDVPNDYTLPFSFSTRTSCSCVGARSSLQRGGRWSFPSLLRILKQVDQWSC
jgi:hypothetical protein